MDGPPSTVHCTSAVFLSMKCLDAEGAHVIHFEPLREFYDKGGNHCYDMGSLGTHQLLYKSGIPIYIWAQLNILTDLNIPLWETLLHGDRDHQHIYYLKYGFSLDFNYYADKCVYY